MNAGVRTLWINAAIAATLLAGWGVLSLGFDVQQGDFAAFYTGAAIAHRSDYQHLHDAHLQAAIQRTIVPKRPECTFFVRPHIYAAMLSPLALLSFRAAFAVWVAGQILIFAGCCWWAARRFGPDALPLAGLFPLTIFSAAFGQDAVLYLGILVVSYWLHEQKRPLSSGAVLGLVFLKPHLALLLPVAMAAQRRWRMLAGLAIAGTAEVLTSWILAGGTGITAYLRFLHDRQSYLSPHPERMLNTATIALNLGGGQPGATALMAVAITATLVAMSGRAWWRGLSAAVIGALVIAPHTIPYDAVWAILPAWLIYFRAHSKVARVAALLFFLPAAYLLQLLDRPWTVAPAIVMLLVLLALAWDVICKAAVQPAAGFRRLLAR